MQDFLSSAVASQHTQLETAILSASSIVDGKTQRNEGEAVFTLEATIQAAIILTIAIAIIILNTLIISSFTNVKGTGDVLNIYIMSLSVADFINGVLVVPLSVYAALSRKWVYGDIVCRIVGYTESITWIVSAYTLMWISVDRYIAIRKPLRYDTVQTKTRCQCWMAFTWISTAMMCSPPLLDSTGQFDNESFICSMDWGGMIAYSVTLMILVLGPSLITIIYTYTYTLILMRRLRQGTLSHDKEYVSALSETLSNPNHSMCFILIITFWLLWLPLIGVKSYEYITGNSLKIPHIHFFVVWIGFSHSAWKAFILITFSPQFRVMLRLLCLTLCCRAKTSRDIELMDMDFED